MIHHARGTRQCVEVSRAKVEVSGSKNRKVKNYASPSDFTNANRSWSPPVVGESFHPHGRQHQVDLERRRRHWRGVVAPRRFWVVPLPLAYPHRLTSKQAGF